MTLYRIISKNILCDGLTQEDAQTALEMFREQKGLPNLEIEDYNPEAKRLGRNPDLHQSLINNSEI